MSRLCGRRLELVCILCNEALADLEKACAGHHQHQALNASCTEDYNKNILDDRSLASETATTTDVGRLATAHFGIGGYHPVTNETQREVVATKCGHMFHQGCLRKYVHKTLIEGKGGSLFCPICTRPFAMNRLWPVIIPATKSQRDRYMQLKMMKNQNADMVKQLREIRTKITEEEQRLEKIKEESEQCLQDIQQKQKLLDSVKGPTNKEMVELTKLHMKRQEILHVVTQHNADLLKLLAEESNISTTTAEKMISVKTGDDNQEDLNVNQDYSNYYYLSQRTSSHNSPRGNPSSVFPQGLSVKRKSSTKKVKAKTSEKNKRKSRKKVSHRHHRHGTLLMTEGASEDTLLKQRASSNKLPRKTPSEVIPKDRKMNDMILKKFPGLMNSSCRTVDTFMKWNMESVKELMSLETFSESSLKDEQHHRDRDQEDDCHQHRQSHRHDRQQFDTQAMKNSPPSHKKNSANIMLARKGPININKKFLDGFGKK